MRSTFGLLIGALSLALAACSATPRPVPGLAPPTVTQLPGGPATALEAQGLISPSDVLSIIVYREPDLSLSSVMVAPNGTIQVPLVGNVETTGTTTGDLSRRLTAAFGQYLVHPQVSVNVVSSPTRTVTVDGAVTQPGIYPYLPNTTLISALALARGVTRVARVDQIAVFRTNADGRYLAIFDVDAIRSGQAADLALQPGDQVVVGVSGRRQLWQDFLQTAPLLAVFSRIG